MLFIPGKLTRFLEPLDNNYLLNEDNKLTNTILENPIKFNDKLSLSKLDILRLELINWILEIWEDNSDKNFVDSWFF